jgi:hypothetical protein
MFRKIEFWSFLVAIAALGLGFYYHPPFHSSTKGTGPSWTAQTVAKVGGIDGSDIPIPNTFAGPNPPTGSFGVLTTQTLKTKASVKIDQRIWNLESNSSGMFGRITIPARTVVPIHLNLDPHELVRIQVLDGGQLGTHHQSAAEAADSTGSLDFNFEATGRNGSSRVAITRRGIPQVFDFWIGADLPARVAAIQ